MVHNHMLTDITTKEKCLKDINYQSGGRGGVEWDIKFPDSTVCVVKRKSKFRLINTV